MRLGLRGIKKESVNLENYADGVTFSRCDKEAKHIKDGRLHIGLYRIIIILHHTFFLDYPPKLGYFPKSY